jgi:NAD(P)-dependent dehydrogenase (short-subunit alcohol dehydrogenase family)
MANDETTVFVTGGSGYIAGWVIARLLEDGHLVRTTLREGHKHHREILAELDRQTLPPDAPTTEEWFNRHFPGGLDAASLTSWLPRMILHEEVLDRFGGLHWWCREFEADAPQLLLSDCPIYWNGGFAQPAFHIHFPIGPDRIFFGTALAETEQALSQLPVPELVERVNRATLASSSRRIWGAIDTEGRAFVEANRELIGIDAVQFGSLVPWNKPDQTCAPENPGEA